jgi:hypothetical protein
MGRLFVEHVEAHLLVTARKPAALDVVRRPLELRFGHLILSARRHRAAEDTCPVGHSQTGPRAEPAGLAALVAVAIGAAFELRGQRRIGLARKRLGIGLILDRRTRPLVAGRHYSPFSR